MENRILESKSVFEKIQGILSYRSFNLDNKGIVVLGYLSSSLEYHSSLYLLIEKRRFASASALLRSQFESYVKGIWFNHCSNDNDVERAHRDKFKKTFEDIVSDIEAHSAPGHEDIRTIKNSHWGLLNGFTHTGQPQLARRFNGQNIQANYGNEFNISVLNFGDFFAFRAAIELLSLSSEEVEELQVRELCEASTMLKALFP